MSSSSDSPISSSFRRPSSRKMKESYRLETSRMSFTRNGIRFSKPSNWSSAWGMSFFGRVVVNWVPSEEQFYSRQPEPRPHRQGSRMKRNGEGIYRRVRWQLLRCRSEEHTSELQSLRHLV